MNKKKKRILIIDDEIDLCEILTVHFQQLGFDVLIANNGEDGLAKARRDVPDLVLLDLMLPKLSGEQVCREIRKDPLINQMPIIMLTAKDSDVDAVIGKVIGANAYIGKPFSAKELLEAIHKLIGKE